MRLSSILPTLTATGMAMAAPAKRGPSGDFKGEMVAAHNFFRSQHGVADLTWSDALASKAQNWANGCKFEHSNGVSWRRRFPIPKRPACLTSHVY